MGISLLTRHRMKNRGYSVYVDLRKLSFEVGVHALQEYGKTYFRCDICTVDQSKTGDALFRCEGGYDDQYTFNRGFYPNTERLYSFILSVRN